MYCSKDTEKTDVSHIKMLIEKKMDLNKCLIKNMFKLTYKPLEEILKTLEETLKCEKEEFKENYGKDFS